MPCDILLVTTPPSFGELIQQTLQETGHHRVVFVNSGVKAIHQAQSISFSLAILDADVEDIRLSELMERLKIFLPGLRFMIIPRDNRIDAQEVYRMPIEAFLMKPFYLPDLVEMVSRILPEGVPENAEQMLIAKNPDQPGKQSASDLPPWLTDEAKASQLLTSLSLGSAAQGIMIVQGNQLWAYAGQLTQPAAHEIASLVAHYWKPSAGSFQGKKSDLTRFVRLGASSGEYLLFTTPLHGKMVLALVFEIETPFSHIRSLAYLIARALVSPTGELQDPQGLPASQKNSAEQFSRQSVAERGSADGSKTADVSPFKPLLDDIPSPLPEVKLDRLPEKQEVKLPQPDLASSPVSEIMPVQAAISTAQEHSSSPVVHELSYFCLLIPRMPHHQLIGDLAERLPEWLGQLCMAFGWRLEHLTVSSETLQWIIRAAPTVSPADLMETLRRQTSERIFEHFPKIREENPSGDFWAPGYLIMTQIDSVSDSIIQNFIHQIRQYQGASAIYSSRLRR
jgi:REP element-mobilizing transposase RayT/CheY-like chemotaxis protein